MNDPITRARKEWCEIHDPEGFAHTNVCPTYVVAALLDVLAYVVKQDPRMSLGGREALLAEAAITRALEGKP
jgi:hypothetical protein